MKDLSPILRSLGLLESEIKTYLAAFEHGAGTVLDLTKLTNLSRQATYVAIEALTKRGLMSSVLRGKKHYYTAEHPDKLLLFAKRRESELKERISDLERAVPELELQMGGEKPVVKVYEGKEGVRALIEDIKLQAPSSLMEITDLEAMYKVLTQEDLAGLRAEVKKIKGARFGIYSGESPLKNVDAERFFLPKEFGNFNSNIGIYGDKVALVTFEGRMHSILIESKSLVKTLRILFSLARKGAQK